MPEINNSSFTEVISIEADKQKFVDSLQQLEDAYKSFIERLGSSASNVISVGAFSGVTSQLSTIIAGIDEFNAHSKLLFEALAKSGAEGFKQVKEAAVEEGKAAVESIDEQLAKTKELSSAQDELSRQQLIYNDAHRKLSIEQAEADTNDLTYAEKKLSLQNSIADFQTRLTLLEGGGLAATKENIQAVTDLIRVLKEYNDLTGKFKQVRNSDEAVEKANLQALQDEAKIQQQLFDQELKREKVHQDITSKIQGEQDAYDVALEKQSQKDTQSLSALQAKAEQLGQVLNKLSLGDNLTAQIDRVKTALTSVEDQLAVNAELQKSLGGTLSPVSTDVDIAKQRVDLISQQVALTKELSGYEKQLTADQASRIRSGEQLEAQAASAAAANKVRDEQQAAVDQKRLQTVESLNAAIAKTNNSLRVTQLSDKPAEQLAELQKQLEAVNAQLRELNVLKEQAASSGVNANSSEMIGYLEKENSLLKEQENLTRQVNNAQRASNSESKGFFDSFNEGIGGSIIALTRFTLVWAAIQTAIQAVTAVVKAPFEAMREGLSFLQQMETKATELAPALLQNVKFSNDFAENFLKASENAQKLVAIIRDRSVITGLDQTQITKLVEALLGSGAKEGVRNLEDMVTLAESFALAMKTSGLGALSIQQQVGSITKLFGGQLDEASSKFLQKLNISTAEWENINRQGQIHGDLLQRLIPYIERFQQANKLVEDTQDSLIKQLDLMKQKFEAAFAEDVFAVVKDSLKELVGFLKENQDAILAVAKDAGKLIGDLLSALGELTRSLGGSSPLAQLFKFILAQLSGVISLATIALDTLTLLSNLGDPTANKINEVEIYTKNVTQTVANLTKTLKDLYSSSPDENKKDNTKTTFDPLPPPDVSKFDKQKEELKSLEDAYRTSIDAITAKQRELVEGTKEQVSAQELSHKEAAEKIKGFLDEEARAVDAANKVFEDGAKKLIDNINGSPKLLSGDKVKQVDAVNAAVLETEKRGADAQRVLQNAIALETKQGLAEDQAVQKEHLNAILKLKLDTSKQQLAIDKAQYDEGLLSAARYYDEQLQVVQEEYSNESITIADQIALHKHVPKELENDLNRQTALDQAYTAKVNLLKEERIKAIQDETKAKLDFFTKLKTLQTQSATEADSILKTLGGTTYITDQELKLFDAKQQTLAITQRQYQAELLQRELRGEESKQTRQLTLDVQALYNQRLQLLNEELTQIRANNAGNSAIANKLSTQAVNNVYGSLVDEENAANKKLNQFSESTTPGRPLTPDQAANLDALSKAAHDAAAAVGQLQATFDYLHPSLSRLFNDFIGFDFKAAWNSAEDAIGKVAVASNAATEGLKTILNLASVYAQGAKQGGALGGAGAVISNVSSGPLGQLLFGKDSIVSQFLPAIGSVLSFVGSMFTAAAKKIADEVKKSFQTTLDNYQNGNATLIQTIGLLEQQRADAISRLSGKKGGQDQLDSLLPQFDQEIAQLQLQAKGIITSFEDALHQLNLQSDTLSTMLKQWEDINKQVTDYINAGGDAAKAAQYLSLSLQKIQQDAQTQLNDGQAQAVQDAIQLNSLIEQRTALLQSQSQAVFSLQNADSIELMQAGSVSRGSQILSLKQQNQQQLDSLNSQITTLTTKVGLERQVFDIASSTADLQKQSDQLTLDSLDTQISKWKDLQTIVGSITQNGSGAFVGSGIFGGSTSTTNTNINNTINVDVSGVSGDPTQIGQQVADSVSQQLAIQLRQASGYAQ